jgi:hypothetical protein
MRPARPSCTTIPRISSNRTRRTRNGVRATIPSAVTAIQVRRYTKLKARKKVAKAAAPRIDCGSAPGTPMRRNSTPAQSAAEAPTAIRSSRRVR